MANTILITGGCGFIGANFVHYWLDQQPDDRIIVLDKLTYAADPECFSDLSHATKNSVELVVGDIANETLVNQLFVKYGFDSLVHFAAESHVDRSIEAPGEFIHTNIVGTHVLLAAARRHWSTEEQRARNRFHHVSTDEVFGSLDELDPPFSETTAYQPNSPYAASKAASDHLVRSYFHTYGLNVTTTNCSNNFGPRQDKEKLIPKMIHNILAGNKVPIYGDGRNIRDWLFVKDHCRAIAQVLKTAKPGEVFCIGGRCEMRNLDIAHSVCTLIDERFKAQPALAQFFPHCPSARATSSLELLEFVVDRQGHDWRYAINDEKFEAVFGALGRTHFDEALQLTLDYYLGIMMGPLATTVDQ